MPTEQTPPIDPTSHNAPQALETRRKRLIFRAHHRGTKEADLMIGGFVRRHIETLSEAELLALETVLDLPDLDLTEWLTGRRPLPEGSTSTMLARLVTECGASGAGVPPETRLR